MNNKKALLRLLKWTKWSFRWFRRKNIDAFLKEGGVQCENGQKFMIRKCFESVNNNYIREYWIKIEFFVTEPRPNFHPDLEKELDLGTNIG